MSEIGISIYLRNVCLQIVICLQTQIVSCQMSIVQSIQRQLGTHGGKSKDFSVQNIQ